MTDKPQFPLQQAKQIAEKYIQRILPLCERAEVAGSIRRECEMVGDIEIVCQPKLVQAGLFSGDMERDVNFGHVVRNMAAKIIKGSPESGKYIQLMTPEGIKIDLFTANSKNWGYIMAIRTGSADFSRYLASEWKSWGYEGKDGYLTKCGDIQYVPSEGVLFGLIDVPLIHPKDRIFFGLPEGVSRG